MLSEKNSLEAQNFQKFSFMSRKIPEVLEKYQG